MSSLLGMMRNNMTNEFFPYNFYSESLSVEIKDLLIDDVKKNHYIDNEQNCINLEILKNWETIECEIIVRVPKSVPQKISPQNSSDAWKAVLILKSMAGSGRQIGWRNRIPL